MKRLLSVPLVLALVGALCWPGKQSTSQTTDVTLIGAGDVADGFSFDLSGAFQTAALLDANPTATVFITGDDAYDHSSDFDYAKAYDATWGRARARTIPVAGHHEWTLPQAIGFFNYWGPVVGVTGTYYRSMDLGAWHVVVLDANCDEVGCGVGGA